MSQLIDYNMLSATFDVAVHVVLALGTIAYLIKVVLLPSVSDFISSKNVVARASHARHPYARVSW